MNSSGSATLPLRIQPRRREQARTQIFLVVLICFIFGLGAGAVWYRHAANAEKTPRGEPSTTGSAQGTMTETLKSALRRLDVPVEIRFYAPASRTDLPESLQPYADRVDQLLARFQGAAAGKIQLSHLDPQSNREAELLCKADGIKPLPLPSGDFYYLGLAVCYRNQKETISPLDPDWELALPSDLSRAILRVTSQRTAAQRSADTNAKDPTTAREATMAITRAIPNIAGVSLDDGTQLLQDAAVAKFKVVLMEMQAKVTAAQQKLAATQNAKSDAEQQTAREQLRQVQEEQTEKLRQITQSLQDQINALKQLKTSNP